jgi:hypothetical protein
MKMITTNLSINGSYIDQRMGNSKFKFFQELTMCDFLMQRSPN